MKFRVVSSMTMEMKKIGKNYQDVIYNIKRNGRNERF